MREVLTVQGLSKWFGELEVLRGVDLTVRAGEVVCLVGPSGCGKSTLLRIAAGLETVQGGTVAVAGTPVRGPHPAVGVVFQEPRLMPWLTVAENIALGRRLVPALRAQVAELVVEMGLGDFLDALPKQLSGGMAQRVAIARGLFHHPELLLLDEPFSAVDALTRMRLQEMLLRVVRTRGTTMLLVTHDVDEAVYLADRVVVMSPRPGRIRCEIPVELPHPRSRHSPQLTSLRGRVLAELLGEWDTAAD
ncbi:ABC transporter ATP-binding protein [Caldinitratiruptor microaerophilus]|uniref:Sulfonate ABC transporter ATP-binding protein n=1 Tax=Caldinitratiruptor microaerophilus TaxID=671077 RepID=A0AA35CNW4_9FIRM|nr:ABC transporter ATP-binding protein [Caldinitratiruptor microaerophilus]BDG60821.1 sulfonate ABC transporter ATP-binding protein [Caldinitratiruptor microaerophilus]